MMKNQTRQPESFRQWMTFVTALCWVLPILLIVLTAQQLLDRNYNRSQRRTAQIEISNSMRQLELRLRNAMEDADNLSFDGTIQEICKTYHIHEDAPAAEAELTEYLCQKFDRNVNYQAVFLVFAEDGPDILPYSASPELREELIPGGFRQNILPTVRELLAKNPEAIQFMEYSDRLFMIHRLTESEHCIALVMDLEKSVLLQSLYDPTRAQLVKVTIDSVSLRLVSPEDEVPDTIRTADVSYSIEAEGHTISCSGQILGLNLWRTMRMVWWILAFLLSLVIPVLALIFWLFHRHITHPLSVLIEANTEVQAGHRGYQITDKAPNSEFYQLFHHFNTMSQELETQFQQLFQEQQALQQAKIRALQSQINPHFLNNTLEVINWEARLADNERVCSMIEALSTMLDASIGRSGRSQVSLREEMKYVDAYLYISQERMGDRLVVDQEIEGDLLDCTVPLLMLQPLVENAVEHNLSRTGGELCLRAYEEDCARYFEVEHDGVISPEGRERIRQAMEPEQEGQKQIDRRSVGIRNINVRLGLMYGGNYRFTIRQIGDNRVLAQIILFQHETNNAKNKQ